MEAKPELSSQTEAELSVLRKFALRWAVLAAWDDELGRAGLAPNADAGRKLESSRVKISSGCFSSCEVGCDLAAIESLLVSRDASRPDTRTGFWLDLLGQAMERSEDIERLLAIPAVRFQYAACGFGPCRCGG